MITEKLQEEFAGLLHQHVPHVRITGAKVTGHVPWREDKHASFSADVEKGAWYDHARHEGGGVKEFKERVELNGAGQSARKIVANYDYTDEAGNLLYQVVRYAPKDFRQRRPDGKGGWIDNLNGTRRVLYRLPEILK